MKHTGRLLSLVIVCFSLYANAQRLEDNYGISVREFYDDPYALVNADKYRRQQGKQSTQKRTPENPPPNGVFYPDCEECLADELPGSNICACEDILPNCNFDACTFDCDIAEENGQGLNLDRDWWHRPDSVNDILPLELWPRVMDHLYYDKYYKLTNRCSQWTQTGKDLGYKDALIQNKKGDSSIVVAIIDTGIDFNYGDLKGRRWENEDEIAGNGIDDDNNGYIDDRYGYDFSEGSAALSNLESTRNDVHGTLMARVIGSNDDREYLSEARDDANEEYLGIGIDVHCKLMNLKVFETGNPYSSDEWISEAIKYAADNGAHVINVSIGGARISLNRNMTRDQFKEAMDGLNYNYESYQNFQGYDVMRDAAQYAWDKGSLVVVPSGNNTMFRSYEWNHYGLIMHPSTITVSGSKGPERYFDFHSSYHGYKTDVIVPHVISDGNWTSIGGTSLSTAATSGILSLVWAEYRDKKNYEIKELLLETASDQIVNTGYGKFRERCEMMRENWDWSYPVSCAQGYISVDDEEGWDQYYGYGMPHIGRMLNNERIRTVNVNPEDGSTNDYVMKNEWDNDLIPTEYLNWKDDVLNELSAYYDSINSIDTTTVDSTIVTSLLKVWNKEEFNIYPNPSHGKITIDVSEAIKTLEVFDSSGKTWSIHCSGQNLFDLRHLNRGIYFTNIRGYKFKIILL